MKFTLMTRERADYLVDRYSERKEREPDRLAAVASDIGFGKRERTGGVSYFERGQFASILPVHIRQKHQQSGCTLRDFGLATPNGVESVCGYSTTTKRNII